MVFYTNAVSLLRHPTHEFIKNLLLHQLVRTGTQWWLEQTDVIFEYVVNAEDAFVYICKVVRYPFDCAPFHFFCLGCYFLPSLWLPSVSDSSDFFFVFYVSSYLWRKLCHITP